MMILMVAVWMEDKCKLCGYNPVTLHQMKNHLINHHYLCSLLSTYPFKHHIFNWSINTVCTTLANSLDEDQFCLGRPRRRDARNLQDPLRIFMKMPSDEFS